MIVKVRFHNHDDAFNAAHRIGNFQMVEGSTVIFEIEGVKEDDMFDYVCKLLDEAKLNWRDFDY